MKKLRRIIIYVLLACVVLIAGLALSVVLFKDRIIAQFVREANKSLNTPVKIGKIDVSWFEDFPSISIVLKNVYVEDSHEGQYPLLTAGQISFQMNAYELWQGNYQVKGLKISNSETNLKLDAKGKPNYIILKSKGESGKGAVTFSLQDVELKAAKVSYRDLKINNDFSFSTTALVASISAQANQYRIAAEGDVSTDKFQIEANHYLEGKRFEVDARLLYDDAQRALQIEPSDLILPRAAFIVKGRYQWLTRNDIDLKIDGKEANIQTLVSLLPDRVAQKVKQYKSEGNVYFSSRLHGVISKEKNPALTVDFGFEDATVFHPEYKTRIEHATLQGSFASSNLGDTRYASLVLKNVTGTLNNERFTGNFIISNFVDPEVICDFKGKVDAPALLGFYPIETLRDVSGSLLMDLSFQGKIALLKNKATAQRVSTLGSVELQNINLTYGDNRIPLKSLNGNLQFSNNDLALSNVSCTFGNSDFLLNGFFKNVITFLLFEDQPIGIETDLKSKFIDVDELFKIGFGDANNANTQSQSKGAYKFAISRNLNVNFNCDVQHLRYKRFHATALKGDLLVKNEVAVSRQLSFSSVGGDVSLSGIVDAKNTKAIDVVSTLKLKNISIDSAFYVFENFQQDFIQDKHLRGKATADVNLELSLNENLKLFPETLVTDISLSIKGGELNNFEPMKKLNRYLDDATLSKLRFSELKNDIHIENKTIFIPQMDIHSNITDLKISGTHTFDQQIDYRIITPLRKRKVIDVDAQGAIEEFEGQTKLFLKIVGTTDDYKVMYDTEAVKKKIVNDLKKEVQELKDAFRGKKKQKEVEVSKEEYFEWDSNEKP